MSDCAGYERGRAGLTDVNERLAALQRTSRDAADARSEADAERGRAELLGRVVESLTAEVTQQRERADALEQFCDEAVRNRFAADARADAAREGHGVEPPISWSRLALVAAGVAIWCSGFAACWAWLR
jgi:hypothetical protein